MKEFISCNQTELFSDTDSGTIQNAIAAAIEDGCRKVVIPRYNYRTDKNEWRISKAIEVPSDMTIILDNCYMVQETGVYDNMFRNSKAYSMPRTKETEEHDINLIGVGNVCLSGGVHNGLLERTEGKRGFEASILDNQMILWINVRRLRMENIHIEYQRHWSITHFFCENVKIKNIDYHVIPHVPNEDGINLRVGCRNFEIENITGRTGDDTVALTAMLDGEELKAFVEDKPTDICNVKIKNVISDPFRQLNIRVLTQDGIEVHDIDIDTVMDSADYAMKFMSHANSALGIGTQGSYYVKVCRAKLGDLRGITARNIYARGRTAVRIDDACADSTFTNVKTFGICFTGVGTVGFGCVLKSIVFDSLYYGSIKSDMQRGFVDNYLPSAIVRMPKTTGDITVRNVYSDGNEYVCLAEDGLEATFENVDMTHIDNITKNVGRSKIMVNGEEVRDA